MNRKIYIATAPSRMAATWRNQKTTWDELVERCSETHYTHETLAEYKNLDKGRQSDIKDVGGFVGGYLSNGKRSKESVKHRDVLCLDIDYGKTDTWDEFCRTFHVESFCYSTHKYTASAPRIRLVVLLNRSVSAEEYEAVGRAVASRVDIELFDDTTYEAERLMYWPSTSKDGEWFFRHQEGDALDVDNLLSDHYLDWQDVSEWQYSSRVRDKVRHDAVKQGDPTEKPGIVGAFCRCYDIYTAIDKFLPDVYEQTAIETRFTYKSGTVAAGLVVYEDGKFAYSHNATDPCSQHLVNAFDLVRLHKFGLRDEDVIEGTAVTSLPSYKAMADLASNDPDVKKTLMKEKMDTAVKDFSSVFSEDKPEPESTPEENDDWMAEVELNKNGSMKNTIANVCAVLENAKEFKGKLWHNDFDGLDYYNGKLPWSRGAEAPSTAWSNADSSCLREHLERKYGLTGKDRIDDALITVAYRHRRHPIREYLRSLTWDGVPRLDTLFIDFMGTDDTELIRMQTRKQLVSAVARVMQPGIKFDYMLVIVGEQGIGKSTLLMKLAGKWFNDSIQSMDGKDGMEILRSAWIIEIGELVSLKKSEVESVKAYLTRQTDRYRPAYGRRVEEVPRQCIFFATTNERNFLKDITGNRRFWVVESRKHLPRMHVFRDFTEEYRGQVWAEAVARYDAGEELFLQPELEMKAREVQLDYNEFYNDERKGILEQYLETRLPSDWESRSIDRRVAFFKGVDLLEPDCTIRRDTVSAVEILVECFKAPMDEKLKYRSREITALMSTIPGWKAAGKRERSNCYGQQRVFKRIITDDEEL